jgi:alkyl sulfatase BDS1-like metallo-beta-lactamase superfamily hydrolase
MRSATVQTLTAVLRNPEHAQEPMPAEPALVIANSGVLSKLPFSDRQDFWDAMRGFIATTVFYSAELSNIRGPLCQ